MKASKTKSYMLQHVYMELIIAEIHYLKFQKKKRG